MEKLRVGFELGGKVGIIHLGGAFNSGLIDINEEFVIERFAAEEDWEIVTATIGKGEFDADLFTLDDGGQGHAITDMDIASRITNALDLIIISGETFAGIKRASRTKKAKLKLVLIVNLDVAGPD